MYVDTIDDGIIRLRLRCPTFFREADDVNLEAFLCQCLSLSTNPRIKQIQSVGQHRHSLRTRALR